MRAGKLRRRVSLERRQVIQDVYGAEIVSWAEFAAVHASVEPLSGREIVAALGQGEQALATTRIRIRSWRGVDGESVRAADRVRVGGQVFDIEAVLEDERGVEMQLMCREARD